MKGEIVTDSSTQHLSRRERQIMDVIYRLGRATAAEVHESLDDAPSLNSIRRLIGILEAKGHLRHEWDGPRHVYLPVVSRRKAGSSALDHLKETFFGGSAADAMAALFDRSAGELSGEDLAELAARIEAARKEKR